MPAEPPRPDLSQHRDHRGRRRLARSLLRDRRRHRHDHPQDQDRATGERRPVRGPEHGHPRRYRRIPDLRRLRRPRRQERLPHGDGSARPHRVGLRRVRLPAVRLDPAGGRRPRGSGPHMPAPGWRRPWRTSPRRWSTRSPGRRSTDAPSGTPPISLPHGVLYEDQPVSTRAFAAARTFDVLAESPYLWREREDAYVDLPTGQGDHRPAGPVRRSVRQRWTSCGRPGSSGPTPSGRGSWWRTASASRSRTSAGASDEFWAEFTAGLRESSSITLPTPSSTNCRRNTG